MNNDSNLYTIPTEKILLHVKDNKIVGYTSMGSYDMNLENQPLVSKDILPPNFFLEFSSEKFLYQDYPVIRVIENPNYQPPKYVEETDDTYSESTTVSLKEYNELKDELSDIKTMLYNLTDILTKGGK